MDDIDRATDSQMAELDRIITAARGIPPTPAAWCRDCDEPLPVHRQPYGTCYLCQSAREARERRKWRG